MDASELNIEWKWHNPNPTFLTGFRRALILAWRHQFGDNCPDCKRKMIFNRRRFAHKQYATVDHITARCLGGTNDLENLRVICKQCNNKKAIQEGIKKWRSTNGKN